MKFSPDSKFMNFCQKAVELTKLNLLWLLCCVPVFTAGASTTALITALYAYREGEDCGAGTFFRAFRASFRKATVIWLLSLLLGCMLALDYWIVAYLEFPGRMAVIGLIFFAFFLLVLFSGIIYPLLSQFPGSVKEMIVNGVLLCLANLPKALLIAAMNLLPLLLALVLPQVLVLFGWLFLLCGFSLMALYDIQVAERIFAPFRQRADGEQPVRSSSQEK